MTQENKQKRKIRAKDLRQAYSNANAEQKAADGYYSIKAPVVHRQKRIRPTNWSEFVEDID